MAEERLVTERSFLGRGWSFPPEFGSESRSPLMVSEEEDIRQSLRILMSTAPGERVMYPGYGCGLKRLVFHGMTANTVTQMKDLIERAVLFYEPRITLEEIGIDATRIYEGEVLIELDYTVRSTNARNNLVYPFYLLEGSNPAGEWGLLLP